MSSMGDSAPKTQRNLLPVVSLAVAALSLMSSAWQAYINSRNMEIVQRDIGRRELVRVCRDVIEAYFHVKLTVETAAGRSDARATLEPRAAVNRFAALGTYLANFQGEGKRAEYTELSRELQRLAQAAPGLKPEGTDTAFARADGLFAALNDDCVRSLHVETR